MGFLLSVYRTVRRYGRAAVCGLFAGISATFAVTYGGGVRVYFTVLSVQLVAAALRTD